MRAQRGRPKNYVSKAIIAGAEENLRLAAEYKRLGYDPEILEDAKFQAELDRGVR